MNPNNNYKKYNNKKKQTSYNNNYKKSKYNDSYNQPYNGTYNGTYNDSQYNQQPYYDPLYQPYYDPLYQQPYYDPLYQPYYDPLYQQPYYDPLYQPQYYNPYYNPYYYPYYHPLNLPDKSTTNLLNALPDKSVIDLLNSLKTEKQVSDLLNKTDEKPIIKTQKNIDFKDIKIECLEDLVKLIENNIYDSQYEYNIDLEGLTKIKDDLIQLISMVGLKKLKKSIFEQILYFIQKLQSDDFKHTVLYGPPGTGKTEVAKILGRIYSKIGILSKNIFKKVSRSDLVAGFLGQTAIKTKDVIKQCLGGVLFIDEAYSLGTVSKSDSFSRECIDTLCHESSEHKKDLIIMIAGYENELKESFFELNKGLDSRFIWRFEFEPYSAHELSEIFLLKIKASNWNINVDSKELQKWFETNISSFKFFGRDIEVLFLKTKIAHSRRIFGLEKEFIKKINILDLNNGFSLFKESIKEKISIIPSMYC